MADLKFIRQRPSKVARYYDTESRHNNRSVWPGVHQTYGVRLETDNRTWVTGLNADAASIRAIKNPKLKEAAQKEASDRLDFFTKHFNQDLSATSDFWSDYRLDLVRRDLLEYTLDLEKPEEALQYYVAIANRRLAPSEEDLDEPAYENTFLYVYDPKLHISRRARLRELKDEVGSLIHAQRNNPDRLFYWVAYLNMQPNIHMSREELYEKLNNYRDTKKTVEEFEALELVLNKDSEELQAAYLFRQARQKKRIVKVGSQYTLLEHELGKTDSEAIDTLLLPENTHLLDSLMDLAR
ncbi:hypothetical protein CLV58_109163 [Spirosoma oryzae]|uniref:Uncharacterized protein n=1 Tax=Spirosoma oryzae TaxID=1469603 RepID=A0A2T0SYE9_9BACT|nr:hypothetical protein [Spirosoma oryzae]PRY38436.1 hypothetical protein CLV58_109163 [Spirosoma oryzae]